MIDKYLAPIIDSKDKELPLYVVTVGHYEQHKINRPYGIPHHQILLTVEGSGIMHIDKKKFTLTPGSILITPPHTPQQYRPVNHWTTMYITYVSNWASNYFLWSSSVVYPEHFKTYTDLIANMLSMSKSPDFCRQSSPVLYDFLLRLHSDVTDLYKTNSHLPPVHDYIENHFFEDLNLTFLAEMCGLVPEYFSRIYKKSYHMSPMEHVHKLRMQESKKKLIFSSTPIATIAKSVGYNSPSHFGKLFRQQEAMSPNQFRALYKHT